MGRVIVCVSRKGGVGKTTTVANLAAAGVSAGSTVAMIDLDTQGTLSRWAMGRAGVDRLTPERSVRVLTRVNSGAAEPVLTRVNFADDRPEFVHPVNAIPGAFVVPVSPAIRLDDVSSITLPESVADWIVDTSPDTGSSVVHAAIRMATDIVIPVAPELWCLESIPEVLGALRDAGRDDLLERFTVVINMRMKNATHDALETLLRQAYGKQVSSVVFPRAVAFAESALKQSVIPTKSANGKLFASLWRTVTSKTLRKVA
jgi:chromosome partitioning protein